MLWKQTGNHYYCLFHTEYPHWEHRHLLQELQSTAEGDQGCEADHQVCTTQPTGHLHHAAQDHSNNDPQGCHTPQVRTVMVAVV